MKLVTSGGYGTSEELLLEGEFVVELIEMVSWTFQW